MLQPLWYHVTTTLVSCYMMLYVLKTGRLGPTKGV